jgi:serine phosphatase RsbU (regulator of sigma subunit)
LNNGDVIVLMTDGVLEALESDLLTMSTLSKLLAESAEKAGDVHRFLLRKFEDSTLGKRADDMTLITLEPIPSPLSQSFLDIV